MIEEITLPEISENVESGNVVTILVAEGDHVEEDQPILEIETDKASVEVPSTAAGTITEILVSENEDVAVGAVIAKVDTEAGGEQGGGGEEASGAEAPAEGAAEAERSSETAGKTETAAKTEGGGGTTGGGGPTGAGDEQQPAETVDHAAAAESTDEPETEGPPAETGARGGARAGIPPSAGGTVPAAPSTRRFAREIGVDITTVEGSGPGGRVTIDDVKRASREERGARPAPGGVGSGGGARRQPAAAGGMVNTAPLPDFSQWGDTRREKLGSVRRITGENTQASWQTIPHVTQFDEADVTDLEAFRRRFAKLADKRGVKITVTAILLKIVARALERYPRFNASLDAEAEEIIFKDFINISVAADTDRGLLVPVVRNVTEKSILRLAGELGDLAGRARSKQIKPDEMQGGTFTISNLGGIGGTGFSPVVFAPQVAILGVSRAQTKPVWNGEQFVPREIMPLSLSYDHRVVDGADGARFLRWICEAIENPLYMDLEGGQDE